MVNEDAALLNRRVTHMTPAALFSRRLQVTYSFLASNERAFPLNFNWQLGRILGVRLNTYTDSVE